MYQLAFHSSIEEIGENAWQALAQQSSPFLQYHFLWALEASSSVGKGKGWQVCHIAVYREQQAAPVAVMPAYIKYHSRGEYVFDWNWAEAWQSQGLAYYPRLVTAIPFTPSVSPRLLTAQAPDAALLQAITDGVTAFCRQQELSSWHILFPTPAESRLWQQQSFIRRCGTQFHWFNRGYKDFDDFLAGMMSRKRKSIRKERNSMAGQALQLDILQGNDIREAHWDQFYHYYQRTYAIRGQPGYLQRDFFSMLGEKMPQQLVLVMASCGGRYLAAALNLRDHDTLYGRYWGCQQDLPNLHFEACYYQGIDYCIAEGLQRFDAGAQGEHKVKRGFEPLPTWSCHWLADARFRPAVARFCEEEASHVRDYMAELGTLLPYQRQTPATP